MTPLRTRVLILLALAATALAAGLAPGRAAASTTQESMFQDDNHLIYTSDAGAAATFRTLRSLGVDRVRLTVDWSGYAPDPLSYHRPAFDATNPNAYPNGVWTKLDRAVADARANGIGVNLNVTAPMPLWAAGKRVREHFRPTVYDPGVAEYGKFVTAVGRRYSGSFHPADGSVTPPRVNFWSIWNEPNIPGWLTPQWLHTSGHWVAAAPRIYRRLLGAGYKALRATGHAKDTILIGELTSKGEPTPGIQEGMKPLLFMRDLYCVDRRMHALKGRAAREQACSKSGFRKANPALFNASGWAHHPYSLIFAPNVKGLDPDFATLGDMPKLEGLLDGMFRHYGSRRRLPIWLTEYGYQTKPPDPTQNVSPATQGRYLDQAEWMTFHDPRVRALCQFMLRDDPPSPVGKKWRTFQSGLEFANGRHKVSYADYRLPVWLPHPTLRRGSRLTVWGLLRPAAARSRQTVKIQFRELGTTTYRTVRRVTVRSRRGSFTTTIRATRPGVVRIAWGGFASRSSRLTLK